MNSTSSAHGSKPAQPNSGHTDPRGLPFDSLLRHISPILTAIMVDAAFYLKRAKYMFGDLKPKDAAKQLHTMALEHLNDPGGLRTARLYRIFVYDAPPAKWKGHRPISKKSIDYSNSEIANWRNEFHQELRGYRKIALRLGDISIKNVQWILKPGALKELLNKERDWTAINDDDFTPDFRQKGVDMRLGLDIASVVFKKQVNQIILISGDSDFVPAAKLARREGVDFILDPMWAPIQPELYEHIDGLRSVCPRPVKKP